MKLHSESLFTRFPLTWDPLNRERSKERPVNWKIERRQWDGLLDYLEWLLNLLVQDGEPPPHFGLNRSWTEVASQFEWPTKLAEEIGITLANCEPRLCDVQLTVGSTGENGTEYLLEATYRATRERLEIGLVAVRLEGLRYQIRLKRDIKCNGKRV